MISVARPPYHPAKMLRPLLFLSMIPAVALSQPGFETGRVDPRVDHRSFAVQHYKDAYGMEREYLAKGADPQYAERLYRNSHIALYCERGVWRVPLYRTGLVGEERGASVGYALVSDPREIPYTGNYEMHHSSWVERGDWLFADTAVSSHIVGETDSLSVLVMNASGDPQSENGFVAFDLKDFTGVAALAAPCEGPSDSEPDFQRSEAPRQPAPLFGFEHGNRSFDCPPPPYVGARGEASYEVVFGPDGSVVSYTLVDGDPRFEGALRGVVPACRADRIPPGAVREDQKARATFRFG